MDSQHFLGPGGGLSLRVDLKVADRHWGEKGFCLLLPAGQSCRRQRFSWTGEDPNLCIKSVYFEGGQVLFPGREAGFKKKGELSLPWFFVTTNRIVSQH